MRVNEREEERWMDGGMDGWMDGGREGTRETGREAAKMINLSHISLQSSPVSSNNPVDV